MKAPEAIEWIRDNIALGDDIHDAMERLQAKGFECFDILQRATGYPEDTAFIFACIREQKAVFSVRDDAFVSLASKADGRLTHISPQIHKTSL